MEDIKHKVMDDKTPIYRTEELRIASIYKIDEKVKEPIMKSASGASKTKMYKKHTINMLEAGLKDYRRDTSCYNYFFVSICISFIFGLSLGVFLMVHSQKINLIQHQRTIHSSPNSLTRTLNSYKESASHNQIGYKPGDTKEFSSVTFIGERAKDTSKYNKEIYPKGMTDDMKDILKDYKSEHRRHEINTEKNRTPNDKTVLYDNIYWGTEVEKAIPKGYDNEAISIWEKYMEQAVVVKMEAGCGRMQNRLVTFSDGLQACVRYRQNTDQIQGEIFSFYVAKLLNITNVAPSVVKIVDLKDKLWSSVADDIATVQWTSNRAVVFTQYVPSLEPANIPEIFKPSGRHLNKYDVLKIARRENDTESKNLLVDKMRPKKNVNKSEIQNFDHLDLNLNRKTLDGFVELAQWSDLIVFDYLTANLDRIVNNLFNYQWNVNIMDGPAHNLARKIDNGLLLFLDNESGLLHGYRLLKKYNFYHSLMLDNLCVFRKTTVNLLRNVFDMKNVGARLQQVFNEKNNAVIRDILPPLPEKNAKILHGRIGKVLSQIEKCEKEFAYR